MSQAPKIFKEASVWEILNNGNFRFVPEKPLYSLSGFGHSWLSGQETYFEIRPAENGRAFAKIMQIDHDNLDPETGKPKDAVLLQSFIPALSFREIEALDKLGRREFSHDEIEKVRTICTAFKDGQKDLVMPFIVKAVKALRDISLKWRPAPIL